VERLLPVTCIPWQDTLILPELLEFCEELAEALPSFDFFFTPDQRAVSVLEAFVDSL
jgi:hypothetical protein